MFFKWASKVFKYLGYFYQKIWDQDLLSKKPNLVTLITTTSFVSKRAQMLAPSRSRLKYTTTKKTKKNTTTFIFGTTIHTNIRRLHNTTTFRYDYTYIHKSTTKYNFICKYLTSSYTNVGWLQYPATFRYDYTYKHKTTTKFQLHLQMFDYFTYKHKNPLLTVT